MKGTFTLSVLLFFILPLGAQNTIRGKVTDKDHHPLPGATIFLPDLNKGTMSDKNGAFVISDLPPGKVKLQFSFIGYKNKIESAMLDKLETVMDVTLETTTISTEEIIISGGYSSTQHENAVKIEALKMDLQDLKPTANFMEMITRVPGVDMISKGSGVSKPVIRGLSMNDILVLNNGVLFENYQYSDHHPLGIDEFGIDDIEVIKGPSSLLYGSDAIGGVINFIKEKPAPIGSIEGDYNLQLFSNSLGITNNFGLKGSSRHFFAGIRAGMKSNADYLQGGGEFVPNTRFQSYSVKLNTGYTGKIGSFRLYYDYSRHSLGLAEEEAIDAVKERSRHLNLFYQQFNTHLLSSQNRLYLGRTKLEINSAYQNTELIHFGDPGIYEIQMRLSTLTYETKLFLPSDKSSEYIIGYQGMYQNNLNLNNRETKLLPDATTLNNSLFFLLQKTFLSKIKFQTGLRYDIRSIETLAVGSSGEAGYRPEINKRYNSLSGSAGATCSFSEDLLLRANLASAYRTPNLAELTSNGQHETRYEIGDPDLKPEKSVEADISMHYHLDNLTFDIAGYYNRINDYIFISPTGDTTQTGVPVYRYRQGDSYLYGGEAGIHFHPQAIKWLHFLTTFSTVTGRQTNGEYLPFIPAKKIYSEFQWEKKKISFLYNAYFKVASTGVFRQNDTAPNEYSTNGYFLTDITLGAEIKINNQHLSIGLGVTNIFDKKYIDHLSTLRETGYYNPGRNFTLSLKIPFSIAIKDKNQQDLK